MGKKLKHRLLGAIVVVGLIIILLPLMQGSRTPDITIVKAPPFPDDFTQVNSSSATQPPSATSIDVAPTNSNSALILDPHDTIPSQTPTPINSSQLTPKPAKSTVPVVTPLAEKVIEEAPLSPLDLAHSTKTVPTVTGNILLDEDALAKQPIENNGLYQLKNSAWVIQLGSFKNKANALHLVNRLRASGYHAFIQQISTSSNTSTRVYVGPESQLAAARSLASRLENEVHIHGIVINYEPLAL